MGGKKDKYRGLKVSHPNVIPDLIRYPQKGWVWNLQPSNLTICNQSKPETLKIMLHVTWREN